MLKPRPFQLCCCCNHWESGQCLAKERTTLSSDGCFSDGYVQSQLQKTAHQPDPEVLAKVAAGLRTLGDNNWRSLEYWQNKGRV